MIGVMRQELASFIPHITSLYWLFPLYRLSPDAGSHTKTSAIPLPQEIPADPEPPAAFIFEPAFRIGQFSQWS